MSPFLRPRAPLRALILLAALAGCQDPTDPQVGMQPRSIQGSLSTWTVNSLNDPGDGVCDATECTLREAIAAAAAGDKVVFEGSLQGDIQLAAGRLSIDKSLTVDGAGRITVDAQRNSGVIAVAALTEPTVKLAGLTFKNGYDDRGAGISVGISLLTLDGVTVSDNEATIDGGGIYVGLGSVDVMNSTIVSNIAVVGGGLYNSAGTLNMVGSTVSGNEADNGGGIHNGTGASASLERSTISGNRAGPQDFAGGGIQNLGTLALRSVTLTLNSVAGDFSAGGLRNIGPATMANSIIAGNSGTSGAVANCVVQSGAPNIVSHGHNLHGGCFLSASTDLQVTSAQVFTEVLQQDLKDNGGPTKTHALITRGRAADAGYCPGETADQRGFARPVDDPAMPNALDACDIGAYELQGPVAIVADLMISQSVNKTSVKQGELLTYSIRVQNLGPETAPNVVVTDILPTGATFVEARHNKGTHTAPPRGETGTVTWTVGAMLDQANEIAEITVTVLVKGKTTITNTASVTGDVSDPNEANNTAAIRVSVAAGASKSGGKK